MVEPRLGAACSSLGGVGGRLPPGATVAPAVVGGEASFQEQWVMGRQFNKWDMDVEERDSY